MDLKNTPFFITGTQRSGTTLLFRIVESAARYYCYNEMWYLHDLLFRRSGSLGRKRPSAADYLAERLSITKEATEKSGVDLVDFYMLKAAQRENLSSWCFKDPRVTYFLNDYSAGSCKPKFIIMVRDPRAVTRSYLDKRTFSVGRPTNVIAAALRWKSEVIRQLDFVRANEDRTLIVRYEDLILNFEESITKIAGFIRTDSVDQMLNYHQRKNSSTKIHAGNENILNKPDPSLINQWETDISRSDIQTIESLTNCEMEAFGYERRTEHRSVGIFRKTIDLSLDRIAQEYRWQASKVRKSWK